MDPKQVCIDLVAGTCEKDDINSTFIRIRKYVEQNYETIINQIDRNLSTRERLRGETNRLNSLATILDHLFEDNNYHWGRAAVAMAWANRICPTKEAGEVVANKIAHWIEMNGGFDEFVRFYRPVSIKRRAYRNVIAYVLGIALVVYIWM